MKKGFATVFFACFLLLGFCAPEAFAFRCGNGLVTTGDTKSKVRMTCGNPTSKETRCKNKLVSSTKSSKSKCSDKVEVWYYNCGDNDFIYALTFEDNILTSEETEGRGRGKSNCEGK
ncbi:MAG TPA: DUF2845 domain-containing protein [Smithella sp.]|nr:DUF2845 domain-containing protein [Smithella sp.]HRS97325.1 DUF2845 domain-containing protein [Smithella sp.]